MGINKELMNFIDNTPNSYFCVENIRRKLKENGFIVDYVKEENLCIIMAEEIAVVVNILKCLTILVVIIILLMLLF